MKVPSWKNMLKASPYKGLKGHVYAAGFVLLQGVAFILAKWDFARHTLPVKWQMVKSTKNLCDTQQTLLFADVTPVGIEASMGQ